ncbi:hypothetical protein NQ318_006161 [Aromia moschata]|uniref:Uncharacterized protein n=1 Tax=Aromia moschata TaxID=1265417 RepID=A0AAV8XM50_9CUCU|nr:hypothetical protein NQ318_006161 [Aromia moschata]
MYLQVLGLSCVAYRSLYRVVSSNGDLFFPRGLIACTKLIPPLSNETGNVAPDLAKTTDLEGVYFGEILLAYMEFHLDSADSALPINLLKHINLV